MSATISSRLSAAGRVLCLGFFCGLTIIPLGSLVFRSLVQLSRHKRKLSHAVSFPFVRTERGLIVFVTPPRFWWEKEVVPGFPLVLHKEDSQEVSSTFPGRSAQYGRSTKEDERQRLPC